MKWKNQTHIWLQTINNNNYSAQTVLHSDTWSFLQIIYLNMFSLTSHLRLIPDVFLRLHIWKVQVELERWVNVPCPSPSCTPEVPAAGRRSLTAQSPYPTSSLQFRTSHDDQMRFLFYYREIKDITFVFESVCWSAAYWFSGHKASRLKQSCTFRIRTSIFTFKASSAKKGF